jgi:pseudouridine-5'-phosphate glycosidase
LKVDRIDNPRQIADIYNTNIELGLNNGMLIANPIPEKFEIPFVEMQEYIDRALKKAKENNITGREFTPFLLSEIVKITKGRSLQTNIKLVENNVRLACEIAREL